MPTVLASRHDLGPEGGSKEALSNDVYVKSLHDLSVLLYYSSHSFRGLGSCNISSINLVKSKLVQSDLWVCRVLANKYCAIPGLYDSGLPLQVLRQVPGAL